MPGKPLLLLFPDREVVHPNKHRVPQFRVHEAERVVSKIIDDVLHEFIEVLNQVFHEVSTRDLHLVHISSVPVPQLPALRLHRLH
jgi:hypothetical protein